MNARQKENVSAKLSAIFCKRVRLVEISQFLFKFALIFVYSLTHLSVKVGAFITFFCLSLRKINCSSAGLSLIS